MIQIHRVIFGEGFGEQCSHELRPTNPATKRFIVNTDLQSEYPSIHDHTDYLRHLWMDCNEFL